MRGQVTHLNPEGLHTNPAFTQTVVTAGKVKTVYIGGQNAVDKAGNIVGSDMGTQTEQVFKNLQVCLEAAGAGLEHVVKWNIYAVQGQPPEPAFQVYRQVWGERPNPPLITMMYVAGLANPDFLVELDAIAVVPED